MGFLAIPYPAIDPVALRIGPLAVKWYGLAYVAGLLLGRYYVKALLQQGRLWPSEKRPFTPDKVDDLLLFMTVGVLLGGRLGYVLFYQPQFFLTHRRQALRTPGVIGGAFLVGYGLARSFCELFREPDAGHILTLGPFTAGILYSLPMVLVGILAIRAAGKRSSAPADVQS